MSEEKGHEAKWTEMTVREKVRNVLNNVSVEPVVFFHVLPSVFAGLATQNLNLEKACRVNLKYSDEVCSALSSRQTEGFQDEERTVQKLVASMSVWTTPLRSSIPALLIMFLGSWSDRNKRRKPFMLFPIFGEFMASVGLLVCVYYFYELPMEVAGFVESFFPAITGGWTTLFMAVFSYLADITTLEMRTVRIGALNLCGTVGVPLGTALSGIALNAIGFYGIFSISAVMYMFSITYGIFRIKEPSSMPNVNQQSNVEEYFPNSAPIGFDVEKKFSVWRFLTAFFDLKHIKETFLVVFKKAANNRRQRIIGLIMAQTFMMVAAHGEMGLMYLFMRYRFNWDEVKFSIFSTYSVIVHIIGTSLSMGVFSHLLKFDDAVIGGLSCASKIASALVFAFAQQEWQVYLGTSFVEMYKTVLGERWGVVNWFIAGSLASDPLSVPYHPRHYLNLVPLVDLLGGSSSIALRSIASKLVPTEELGQLNSVYGACEALTPLLHGPLYALVYARTMDTLPGAFFIMSAALTMPALFIFCWMYMQHRRLRLNTATLPSRRQSVGEEVKEPPTPPDRTGSIPLVIIPLDNANHRLKPEENEGGQMNLGFEEKIL